MSKLTFRADDDLVERVEALDASKSEVMRAALRAYLDGREEPQPGGSTLDDLVARRVDELVERRLGSRDRDVNVNVSIEQPARADASESPRARVSHEVPESDAGPPGEPVEAVESDAAEGAADRCGQCGEAVAPEHVYCPNCGEKRSRRVFCDCGDEIRTDWSFCPSCGRRTPAADVLDRP